MFDSVKFWVDRMDISGGKPFDIVPYLYEVTERRNEKSGYSCTGKLKNYSVFVYEGGVSMNGSMCKSFFGDNLHTLTRKDTRMAIDELSDCLHIDISRAKVTRLDVSTILYTKRPPADYYKYLGSKPYFKRLEVVKDETLLYDNYQRKILFYDKTKEANDKDVRIPDILKNSNLLRYELQYTKNLNRQLNADVTGAMLYDTAFYSAVIKNWYNEFKMIQKLKKQSIMADITTVKDAETALFANLLKQGGQSVIDEFLNDLKAANTFKDRQRYYELKKRLELISASCEYSEKDELMQELQTQIFDISRYAR